jgi:hypothetical protein
MGLLLAVAVTAANLDDGTHAPRVLAKLDLPALPRLGAFYQIFQHLKVAQPPQPSLGQDPADTALREVTFDLLKKIRDAKVDERKQLAAALKQYWEARGGKARDDEAYSGFVKNCQELVEDLKDADLRDELNRLLNRRQPNSIAFALVRQTLPTFAGALTLHDRFAKKAGEAARGWIHTPVVVVSGNEGVLAGTIGGHNYSARIVRFKVTTEEKYKGKPAFDTTEPKVILVHSDDFTKVGDMVRPAGMRDVSAEKMLADLRRALEGTPEAPNRQVEDALGLPPPPKEPPPPTARGMADPGRRRGWWQDAPLAGAELVAYRGYREATLRTVVVRREPTGSYSVVYGPEGTVVKARTVDDAVEFALLLQRRKVEGGEGEPLRFVFQGFAIEDARLFTETCRVRAQDDRIDPNIVGYVAGKAGGFNKNAYQADLAKKYNFAGAEVKTVDVNQLKDGSYRLTVTIDVPMARGRVTVREQFSQRTDKKSVRTYGERLKAFLNGIFGRGQSPSDLRDRILKEQGKLQEDLNLPSSEIEVQFRQGAIDFSIVRRGARECFVPQSVRLIARWRWGFRGPRTSS